MVVRPARAPRSYLAVQREWSVIGFRELFDPPRLRTVPHYGLACKDFRSAVIRSRAARASRRARGS